MALQQDLHYGMSSAAVIFSHTYLTILCSVFNSVAGYIIYLHFGAQSFIDIFNFRYFFKTKTKDDGIVYQQIEEDDAYLPKFESKIVGKVKKVE